MGRTFRAQIDINLNCEVAYNPLFSPLNYCASTGYTSAGLYPFKLYR